MFTGSFRALHFAVRPAVLAKYLGQVLIGVGVLGLVPGVVSLAADRFDVALRYGVVIALLVAFGGAASRIRCSDAIQANEAMVVTALAFLLSGLAMSYPMAAYGLDPLDAVFESISGVTTTGLSTLGSLEGLPAPFLFARAWLQWIGGLGVVVLVLAFMVPSGIAAKRLGFDEREAADYVGGTRSHARLVLTVYSGLTVFGIALCAVCGLSLIDSLLLALSAVSTGGFAPTDASLIDLGPWQQGGVSLVCLSGAIALTAYARGPLLGVARNSGLWMLLASALVCAGLLHWIGTTTPPGSGASAWGRALWMSVSAQTTAGFATLPADALAPAGKLVLIGQMLVGGDLGSTAGGLKLLRLLILMQIALAAILRTSIPTGSHLALRIRGTKVESSEVAGAAGLLLVYVGVLGVSWLAFLAAGYAPLDALFDVASALGTAGLSVGVTAPDLEPWLKVVLCIDMLMGRVEVFAFLILAFPGTWIGRRQSQT